MDADTPVQHAQPDTPPAFNGWAVYGWAWAWSITRLSHQLIGEKNEEIARLRAENTQLLNRLLKRQSTEPMPVEGEQSNGHHEPPVRREFKPPIASHVAAARAQENAAYRQRRVAAAAEAEEEKRRRIREDAERETG